VDEDYAGERVSGLSNRGGCEEGKESNSVLASGGSWMVENPKGCISGRDDFRGGGEKPRFNVGMSDQVREGDEMGERSAGSPGDSGQSSKLSKFDSELT
jgi:hypothetical protein